MNNQKVSTFGQRLSVPGDRGNGHESVSVFHPEHSRCKRPFRQCGGFRPFRDDRESSIGRNQPEPGIGSNGHAGPEEPGAVRKRFSVDMPADLCVQSDLPRFRRKRTANGKITGKRESNLLSRRSHVTAQEQCNHNPVTELLHRIVDGVEREKSIDSFEPARSVAPGKAPQSSPVLQGGVGADQRSLFRTERIGVAIVEFADRERLTETTARHELPLQQRIVADRRTGIELDRRIPRIHRKAGMGKIAVFIRVVRAIGQFIVAVESGQHSFQFQFVPDEIEHFGTHFKFQFGQEAAEGGVVSRMQPFHFFPIFKLLPINRNQFGASSPTAGQRRFVDHRQRGQRRILAPGHTGIGIPVVHPAADELLPVFHRRAVDRKQALDIFQSLRVLHADVVAGLELPVHIKVGSQINTVFFAFCEKVVELIQCDRVESQRIGGIFVDKLGFLMMKPDRIIPHPHQIFHQFIRIFPVRRVSTEAEVDAVKSDSFVRRIFKSEFSVGGGTDKTVFAGRSVQRADPREIQRTAGDDVPLETKPFPLFPLLDRKWTARSCRETDGTVAQRHRGDRPGDVFRHGGTERHRHRALP